MPLYLLSIAIQVAAGVHVLKTGRDMRWLLLIIFVPTIGALIYFFAGRPKANGPLPSAATLVT